MTPRDIIKTIGVFAALDEAEIDQMASLMLERRFGKGHVLIEQGDEADALYIVVSGRLKATIKDAEGNSRLIGLYSEGVFFGEMASVSGQGRSATVTAATDCVVSILRKEDFESFVMNNIRAMRPLLKEISERKTEMVDMGALGQTELMPALTGKVVTVWSPKGGVGKTTVAVNLAVALRESTGKAVALVDASLSFGGVGPLLGLTADRNSSDLVDIVNDLDHFRLDSVLYPHPTGIQILLAPTLPDFRHTLTGDHLQMIVNKLCELFDYVVVDSSMALEEGAVSMFDISDVVILLTTVEANAVGNVKAFITTSDSLGYDRSSILMVANCADNPGAMRIEDAETIIGHQFTTSIVSGGMLATQAGNKGVPIVLFDGKSRMAADLRGLADATLARLEGRPVPRLVNQAANGPVRSEPVRKIEAPQAPAPEKVKSTSSIQLLQSIFHGLGVLLISSILFLSINAGLAFSVRSSPKSYPYFASAGALLVFSVFLGSIIAIRLDQNKRSGWRLGLILGLLYGILLAVVSVAVADMSSGSILVSRDILVLAIPLYGFAALVGGVFGAFRRPG